MLVSDMKQYIFLKMAFIELDSFVEKFKNLWHAGIKASLNIEADHGQASVTLKAGLGQIPPPLHHGHVPQQYRGPAYHRRQDRRQAARVDAGNVSMHAEQAVNKIVPQTSEEEVAEEATKNDKDEADKAPEVAEEVTKKDKDEADKAPEYHECDLCDFKSKWKNGLKIHVSKKHSAIKQFDGNADETESNSDETYEGTKHYWERGKLGSAYQTYLDAMEIIEKSELSEEEKETEKAKVLEERKFAFGSLFKYYPPWST